MAYFRCSTGSVSSGDGVALIVECDSNFAGATITATNGTDTYTQTCPSTSPYTVTFEDIAKGNWTVSGIIAGITYSESVLVQDYTVELQSTISKTITVYSANNDTVSYIGLDNQTHTITTNSSGQATATIEIFASGSTTLTFTSNVAKSTSNVSNNYTKSIEITSSTSAIYVMPDRAIYWYGYKPYEHSVKHESTSKSTITFNTNNVTMTASSDSGGYWCSMAFNTKINKNTLKAYVTGTTSAQRDIGRIPSYPITQKNIQNSGGSSTVITLNSVTSYNVASYQNQYPAIDMANGTIYLNAMWLE